MKDKKRMTGMEIVACIDIEKYSTAVSGIRSATVILTENQKEHIIKRRGREFFDYCRPLMGEILEDPDYILRDRAHENTVICCKTFLMDGKFINLVVRLAAAGDTEGLESSIITAIVENDRRYRQRLRNNIPLYKRE